ncbi:LysR family transcriptional regulator [Pseudomonas sp. ADAK18]|uniref:LysR family transcriptional regulator n=1 Tax=Pseudomonas sp. ADAK18 TaxID=2730848 RepID=UPI001463941D|nr:LysR family transcriptional regulator [Pseudomonas sp. ADAK18]QJI29812.1 LysR family transcriptional regulator [Pseudomonas sp. ADAK18]
MNKTGLNELEAVMAVARHRSFRAAATELNVSTSALSHSVAALEARMGVRLFNRTTRSVSLSEVGAEFIGTITPALATIRMALEQAGNHHSEPTGTLRLGAAKQIMPLLLEYLQRYPQMKLDIVTEGRLIDIIAQGFDAGIRLGDSVPQDMIAVDISPAQRFAVLGSPDYFARHPVPFSPLDLRKHQCIRSRMPSGAIYRWEFERHGETLAVDVQGALTLDNPTLMLEAARAGLGLTYLTEWNAAVDLATGSLVRVLKDWTPALDKLCLYYPGRRHVPAGLRALIELIREQSF